MPNIGDMVVGMGLDDSKWVAGVMRIQNQSKQLGNTLQSNMGGGLARSAGQIGFALQDFSSVFAMGGPNALGRAMMSTMNNVQMLGAAFGPWGMAATAAAGAIGSLLLPKLLETDNATQKLTESLKEQTTVYEKLGKAEGDRIRGIKDWSKASPEQLDSEAERMDLEATAKKAERTALGRREMELEQQLKFMSPGTDGGLLFGGKKENPAYKAVYNELASVRENLANIDRESTSLREGASSFRDAASTGRDLKGAEAGWDAFLDKLVKGNEEAKKTAGEAGDLWKATRTPFEEAQGRLQQLEQLARRGMAGPDLVSRAGKDIVGDFRKTLETDPNRKLEASEAGSAAAFSELQASLRAMQPGTDKDAEKVDLLKQQVQKLSDIATALKAAQGQKQPTESL